MAREFQRSERVADYLQQELALLIMREVRDPRLQLVDVTAVDVSRDLSFARVHVTFPGDSTEEEIKERVAVLNGAGGYLRSLLAKGSALRTTPKLKFFFDESIERGSNLTRLIEDVVERDKQSRDEAGDLDDDES